VVTTTESGPGRDARPPRWYGGGAKAVGMLGLQHPCRAADRGHIVADDHQHDLERTRPTLSVVPARMRRRRASTRANTHSSCDYTCRASASSSTWRCTRAPPLGNLLASAVRARRRAGAPGSPADPESSGGDAGSCHREGAKGWRPAAGRRRRGDIEIDHRQEELDVAQVQRHNRVVIVSPRTLHFTYAEGSGTLSAQCPTAAEPEAPRPP
jgi:hypothetical protein